MHISIRSLFSVFAIVAGVWTWLMAITYFVNHSEGIKTLLFDLVAFNAKETAVSMDKHTLLQGDLKQSEQHKQQSKSKSKPKPKPNPTPKQKQNSRNNRRVNLSKNFTSFSQNFYADIKKQSPSVAWNDFVATAALSLNSNSVVDYVQYKKSLQTCPAQVVERVTRPMLDKESYAFCQWALDSGPKGGHVQVGTSYGVLNPKQRGMYEAYSCNSVQGGRNPSCDDGFGDQQVHSWRGNPVKTPLCNPAPQGTAGHAEKAAAAGTSYTSEVRCYDSNANARFCIFDNAVMDFSKMHTVHRSMASDSRRWDTGFLQTHCDARLDGKTINYYDFYAPHVNPASTMCDYVFTEPVLVVSHDQIKNLGHTMNDFMNTFLQLWLSGTAGLVEQITLLNMDAVREGHNYNDELTNFGLHYSISFGKIVKAASFASSRACFKRLIFLPRPYMMFTWDGWFQDMPCPKVGPSSLFQRWNMQIRQKYQLLQDEELLTNRKLRVVVVERVARSDEERSNPHYNTRLIANMEAIRTTMTSILHSFAAKHNIPTEIVIQNLSELTFDQQVKLISQTSLLIGIHGAGITHSMHMPVGTKFCCGVIEIFPVGEFEGIRGHGNMARRLGLNYDRIFLGRNETNIKQVIGSTVPTARLGVSVEGMLEKIRANGSCVLPSVLDDAFFDKRLPAGAWLAGSEKQQA